MTDYRYLSLSEAYKAVGVAVVIDVLRAFTTAAYALAAGVERIYPVSGVSEAIHIKKKAPGFLVMGEDKGVKPEGFDFGNSPVEISKANLNGKTIVQRTSNGTQGVVRANQADQVIAASFVVAKATVNYIKQLNPDVVSFVITGNTMALDGEEDRACGEYLEAQLENLQPVPNQYFDRVKRSSVGRFFLESSRSSSLSDDLALSLQINRFEFCMPVRQEGKLLKIEPYYP